MSDHLAPLREALTDLLERGARASTPERLGEVWSQLRAGGFIGIGVAEPHGGSGGTLTEAAVVARACARFPEVSALPIGGTLLVAHWLRSCVGLPASLAPTALAPNTSMTLTQVADGYQVTGIASRIAGARLATEFLLVAQDAAGARHVVSLAVRDAGSGMSVLTDSSRRPVVLESITIDSVRVGANAVRALPAPVALQLQLRLGLLATVHIAGLIDEVFELTLRYSNERQQFGRRICDFQMVKDMIALLGGEVAVAGAAADAAVTAAAMVTVDELAIRAGRVRAARAATAAARLAHQIHGTIGVTSEYPLHAYTSQLWYWRDAECPEYDSQRELGRLLAARGAQNLWPAIVGE